MSIFNNIYIFDWVGKRKFQEDGYIFFSFKDNKTKYEAVFIFDGHGAKEAVDSLPDIIKKNHFLEMNFNQYFLDKELNKQTLSLFFSFFDNFLYSKINKKTGLCLSGIIFSKDNFFVLTLGDTTVRIFNKDKKKLFQSEILNLSNKEELKRIRINNDEKYIKNGRFKGLIVTRTLGDFDCKDFKKNSIIPIPIIKAFTNKSELIFLLNTDGTDHFKENEIIEHYLKNDLDSFCYKNKDSCIDNATFLIFSNKNNNLIMEHNTSNNKPETNLFFYKALLFIYDF